MLDAFNAALAGQMHWVAALAPAVDVYPLFGQR